MRQANLETVFKLGSIFTRRKRKSKFKPERSRIDEKGRPVGRDILDKADTSKLTHFWESLSEDPGDNSGIEFPVHAQTSAPAHASGSDLPKVEEREEPEVSKGEEKVGWQTILKESATFKISKVESASSEETGVDPVPSKEPEIEPAAAREVGAESTASKSASLHETQLERSYVMDPTRLTPQVHDGEKRKRATKDAQDMAEKVRHICERNNVPAPPYEFVELIGKGTSGRVYKCKDLTSGQLVAIKIMNTDDIDYSQPADGKDDTIRDFRKEVTTLQQLRDINAKNINVLKEAFDLQEQLWIVSEYCTGGSVRTLLRSRPPEHPGLEERFLIPIARELAVGVKSVHDNQVIHRDIKCTNVYVTEEGDIQLGDFGIVGVMESPGSKRRTVVGTPHWMSREVLALNDADMHTAEGYGKEVDIWSYGITIYEMATGNPPNTNFQLQALMEVSNAPRLEGGNYSQELRDFIAFCLNSNPQERPTIDAVLKHPYLAGTTRKYPTKALVELIHNYKAWEYGGGVRASLWLAGGAPGPGSQNQEGGNGDSDFDDWNFSTSDGFNEDWEHRYSQDMTAKASHDLRIDTSTGTNLLPLITNNLTPFERRHQEMSASRGERSLGRLWDPHSAPYELHTPIDDPRPISDLPLRNFTTGQTRESVIDLDAGMDGDVPTFNFDFGDQTLKPRRTSNFDHEDEEEEEDEDGFLRSGDDQEKRATMEWTFPTISNASLDIAKRATMDWKFPQDEPKEPEVPDLKMSLPSAGDGGELPPGFRPRLMHTATEPLGQFNDFIHSTRSVPGLSGSPNRDSMASTIDLDLGMPDMPDMSDMLELRRPSTASSTAESIMTDMTSGNPFFLEEDPYQRELDRNRYSSHKQYRSEGGQFKRSSGRSVRMHTRGSSMSSMESDIDRQLPAAEDMLGYEYSYAAAGDPTVQLNGTMSFDSFDLSKLPTFDHNSGFAEVRNWTDGLDDVAHQVPMNGQHHARSRQPSSSSIAASDEIEFPPIMAPHANALLEDADPQFVMSELNRLLEDFGEGLKATSRAIQQRAEVYIDDDEGEMESGTDGSGGPTVDEEEAF